MRLAWGRRRAFFLAGEVFILLYRISLPHYPDRQLVMHGQPSEVPARERRITVHLLIVVFVRFSMRPNRLR